MAEPQCVDCGLGVFLSTCRHCASCVCETCGSLYHNEQPRLGCASVAARKLAECFAERAPRCSGCGNEIDPDVCGCGADAKSHSSEDGHPFVPMGCDCLRSPAPSATPAHVTCHAIETGGAKCTKPATYKGLYCHFHVGLEPRPPAHAAGQDAETAGDSRFANTERTPAPVGEPAPTWPKCADCGQSYPPFYTDSHRTPAGEWCSTPTLTRIDASAGSEVECAFHDASLPCAACQFERERDEVIEAQRQQVIENQRMQRERDAARSSLATVERELERMRERESHYAKALGVADGGQYRADWDGAISRVLKERDALKARVGELEAALREAKNHIAAHCGEFAPCKRMIAAIDAALSSTASGETGGGK